jgi:signal transduction histidine kinase
LVAFLHARCGSIADSAWDRMATSAHTRQRDAAPVRAHASQLLDSIATGMEMHAAAVSSEPSASAADSTSPAQVHAKLQVEAAYTVEEVAAEFGALRYCTMQQWQSSAPAAWGLGPDPMIAFHGALDDAMGDCVRVVCAHAKASTERFIGVLAHDIRNPLATVSMCVQHLLARGQIEPDPARRLLNSAHRISGIVEQVADYTRAQALRDMPLRRKEGDLRSHLIKVVEEAQALYPQRDIQFESQGRFQGQWDEVRVGQLLSNLLGNAIQHGDSHGPVRIMLRETEQPAGGAEIAVYNSGPGIPAAERATLFEPLSRGVRAADGAVDGLGLGLFICREIVHSHGGTLQLESSDEAGTRFVATLPPAP